MKNVEYYYTDVKYILVKTRAFLTVLILWPSAKSLQKSYI